MGARIEGSQEYADLGAAGAKRAYHAKYMREWRAKRRAAQDTLLVAPDGTVVGTMRGRWEVRRVGA